MSRKKKSAPLSGEAVDGCLAIYWVRTDSNTIYSVAKPNAGLIQHYDARSYDDPELMDLIIVCHQIGHDLGDGKVSAKSRRIAKKALPGAIAVWLHKINRQFVLLIADADEHHWYAAPVTSTAATMDEFLAWVAEQDLPALAAAHGQKLCTLYAAAVAKDAAHSARTAEGQ